MSSEPTEMAGVAEAETQAAYAWALDDGDDLPTQRLTSRRITALSLAASLVVIAVAGVVALVVVRNANHPVAQAPSPHVVETVARPQRLGRQLRFRLIRPTLPVRRAMCWMSMPTSPPPISPVVVPQTTGSSPMATRHVRLSIDIQIPSRLLSPFTRK